MPKDKILITGAAGTIAQLLIPRIQDRYDLILTDQKVLTDQKEPAKTHGFPYIESDIADIDSLRSIFNSYSDIHTVIHLAADIRIDAPWESLLPNNIVGVYNIFETAHEAGCKRIIYASSINSVDGYGKGIQVNTNMPVAPANLYGASKAWGEALGRYYADFKEMTVHCLRIGWVTAHDSKMIQNTAQNDLLHMTITHNDLIKFFNACLASELNFGIWHVISDNFYKRLDISDTKEKLGYAPTDDGYVLSGKIPTPEHF